LVVLLLWHHASRLQLWMSSLLLRLHWAWLHHHHRLRVPVDSRRGWIIGSHTWSMLWRVLLVWWRHREAAAARVTQNALWLNRTAHSVPRISWHGVKLMRIALRILLMLLLLSTWSVMLLEMCAGREIGIVWWRKRWRLTATFSVHLWYRHHGLVVLAWFRWARRTKRVGPDYARRARQSRSSVFVIGALIETSGTGGVLSLSSDDRLQRHSLLLKTEHNQNCKGLECSRQQQNNELQRL